jgi:Acetyl-CoA acetyltransferase
MVKQSALKAGFPVTTTAETLNIVCSSVFDAVNSAARMIQCGETDVVVAEGRESISKPPFAVMNGRYGYRIGNPMVESSLIDIMVNDALWETVHHYYIGITAENVTEKSNLTAW